MTTYTALTTLSGEDAAYRLADDLEAVTPEPTGIGVFEVEDGSGLWEVGAYFTEAPDHAALAVLAAIHGAKPFIVSEVPDQDWVSKVQRELAPVPAGRFFVYGSHDADKLPADAIGLLIDAQMAFGTGHHGTTLGCLRAFDDLLTSGVAPGNVADVGCGTAVLAMAAAKVLPKASVLASDIDPVAVEVANANVVANNLSGRVGCLVAAGFAASGLAEKAPFDLVFANILKGPLVGLAPDMSRNVAPGGHVILSGILNEQAEQVIEVYRQNGFNLVKTDQIVDWATLMMSKNTPV
ncbi:50S ribosomal protein L11 methyltransferase [Yoonia sediminilitoris]|uniref:Ribosomal protein L11 methyltransferase n=1 Tax=Yoonia sediminilitoris TaxID=1286148 RepID=A0A2T6KPP9_9RHOB|nr:50S ribosomal protein L11 methyltransferase [Yoonia sediminilitoris]PUB18531.1 [LSU ribosomal protein L11P]-lysine N-methyltransferase [Yoonia sediminilitoris]RCW98699.1 [LSU ribosomal protein L11P]-lysine N-methyltransferase [Yoonia sediminilitoris]